LAHEKATEQYANQRIPNPGNPSYNEAWALIESARRIAAIIQFGDLEKLEDRRKFRDALRLNLRIWTIFQAEQLVGENQLPLEIRQNILTLCKFIDEHTMKTLSDPTPERAIVLIDINRNIAAGLLGNPDDDVLAEADAEAEAAAPSNDPADATNPAPSPLKIEA